MSLLLRSHAQRQDHQDSPGTALLQSLAYQAQRNAEERERLRRGFSALRRARVEFALTWHVPLTIGFILGATFALVTPYADTWLAAAWGWVRG